MKRVIVLLPLLLGVGCPLEREAEPPPGPGGLRPFDSADQLKAYIADQYERSYSGSGWDWASGFGIPLLAPASMAEPTAGEAATDADAAGGRDGGSFSETNIQEQGVAESDVVITDGTYLYVVTDQTFFIVQAVPAAEMSVVGQLQLALSGDEAYLVDTTAVVISEQSYYGGWLYEWEDTTRAEGEETPLWEGPRFDVDIIDVADPTSPTLSKTYSFEGTLAASRMIGSKLYLVIRSDPDIPYDVEPADITEMNVEALLPHCAVVAADGTSSTGLIADWDDFSYPVSPSGYGIMTVVTLDMVDLDQEHTATGVVSDATVTYASTEALYVTDSDYDSWGTARSYTEVHKFDLSGEAAQYVASGNFPGRLLNQFSLGEKDGFLRVATTEGHAQRGEVSQAQLAETHVFVLEQVDDRLDVAGRIDGIAPGEQLYSARFVGDRGFLVTFEKIDPLFTVDLEDPRNPRLVGELKVPGYSDYIHLLDDDHLLTIGKDAEDVGGFAWYQGICLSIFDVSDFANPALQHREIIGVRGTESEALHNHKAFTLFNDLLAFPVALCEGQVSGSQPGEPTFNGLYVYRVTVDEGISLVGRIATDRQDAYWYGGGWTRGVFIGPDVYAVTDRDVQAAAAADLQNIIATAELP